MIIPSILYIYLVCVVYILTIYSIGVNIYSYDGAAYALTWYGLGMVFDELMWIYKPFIMEIFFQYCVVLLSKVNTLYGGRGAATDEVSLVIA